MVVDYDVKTITAGDYTVEFKMDETQYEYWLNNYHQQSNPINEMAQFKLYVKDILESRIN